MIHGPSMALETHTLITSSQLRLQHHRRGISNHNQAKFSVEMANALIQEEALPGNKERFRIWQWLHRAH